MTDIVITIDSAAIEAILARLAEKSTNLQPALNAIGSEIAANIQLCFANGRSPDGIPWQALSPVTIARRRQNSSQPLLDTGRLAGSITHTVTGDGVEIGTNVIYAALMNFGAKQGAFGKTKRNAPIPWGNIPARPFMPKDTLPGDWEADIIALLERNFST